MKRERLWVENREVGRCWNGNNLIALIFPVKSEPSLSPGIVDMAANIGRPGREKEEKRIV